MLKENNPTPIALSRLITTIFQHLFKDKDMFVDITFQSSLHDDQITHISTKTTYPFVYERKTFILQTSMTL